MERWSPAQMAELEHARRHHPKAHVRTRALGLLRWGEGASTQEVAAFLGVDRHAVLAWRRAFAARGASGLEISPGRGRRSRVDQDEVLEAVQQSPRAFGLAQERWTLDALRRAVPSLRPLRSLRSIQYVLARLGWSSKRGQSRRASPDPEYVKKNSTPSPACGSRAKTRRNS